MSSVKCIWCFNEVNDKNVQYRCKNRQCRGRAVDPIYDNYHNEQPVERGKVLYGPGPGNSSTWLDLLRNFQTETPRSKCPDCDRETPLQICPTCHHDLWRGALTHPQVILSVFGGTGAGKTCYIASLINTLTTIGSKQGLSSQYLSDEDTDQVDDLLESLPDSTKAGDRKLYTFRINMGNTHTPYTVHLFDVSGENTETEDRIEEAVPQLFHSQGVIVIIDPLQMNRVRNELTRLNKAVQGNLPVISRPTMPDRVIGRFLNLYEDRNTGDKPALPVVFTLSKIDRIQMLVHTDASLNQSPLAITTRNPDTANTPQFELGDTLAMHEAATRFLEQWDIKTYNSIRNKFQKYTCSAVSALGSDPVGSDPFQNANAYRVTQPFFWILNELGLLPANRFPF